MFTEIQNIIFPEGILYDRENSSYRTPKVNSAIRLITSIAGSLEEGIKRKAALLGGLSNVVTDSEYDLNQVYEDLRDLYALKAIIKME